MHGSEVCHNKEEIKIKRYFFSFRAHRHHSYYLQATGEAREVGNVR